MREYDQIFDWYSEIRSREIGLPEIDAFLETLPPGSRILDLGCGTGVPITERLVQRGFEVYAIDGSARMVESVRARFPMMPVEFARLQDSAFFNTTFDAVICWGVLFHLEADEQEGVIRRVAQVLNPRGKFLFTSGEMEGVIHDEMNGVPFRSVSLGAANYARIIASAGLELLHQHYDGWENYVYIARKSGLAAEA